MASSIIPVKNKMLVSLPLLSVYATSTGSTASGNVQNLRFNYSDGTIAQITFGNTSIAKQVYDGTSWTTVWTISV